VDECDLYQLAHGPIALFGLRTLTVKFRHGPGVANGTDQGRDALAGAYGALQQIQNRLFTKTFLNEGFPKGTGSLRLGHTWPFDFNPLMFLIIDEA
jgi:hypothetical protein